MNYHFYFAQNKIADLKSQCRSSLHWETGRTWLKPGSTPSSVKCGVCIKEFEIGGSGIAQVDSHARSKTHATKISAKKSQSILKVSSSGKLCHTGGKAPLSVAMQALRAEVINALHTAKHNNSFSSTADDGESFRQMFLGHPATKH